MFSFSEYSLNTSSEGNCVQQFHAGKVKGIPFPMALPNKEYTIFIQDKQQEWIAYSDEKENKGRLIFVSVNYEIQLKCFSFQQLGYYGLNTGLGCLPCNCSKSGSIAEDCNDEGQCRCVPGVAGEKCDHCGHGFYAFQNGGCTRKLCTQAMGFLESVNFCFNIMLCAVCTIGKVNCASVNTRLQSLVT